MFIQNYTYSIQFLHSTYTTSYASGGEPFGHQVPTDGTGVQHAYQKHPGPIAHALSSGHAQWPLTPQFVSASKEAMAILNFFPYASQAAVSK